MRRLILLILCWGTAWSGFSQNLNGTWRGKLTQGPGGCFPVYNIELQLHFSGSDIKGASYHFSDVKNYVKEEFAGTYNHAEKLLAIRELRVLTFQVPADCIPCIKNYNLTYSRKDGKEFLSGVWNGTTLNNNPCPPGTITLERMITSVFNEIKVDTGVIRLDFYDNAEVDNDTISVMLDNKVVISNQCLTAKPITLYTRIDFDNPIHEVIMVGENEGRIPPNTALLMITAGNKRYRLFLSSDKSQKNAIIRFVYEKPG